MVNKSTTRYCPKCESETARNKGGDCKVCANIRAAAYYLNNKQHVLSQIALYRARNGEKIAAQRSEYRQSNRDVIALKKAAYFASNRSRLYAKSIAWKSGNPDKWATYQARYYSKNVQKCADKGAAWRGANRDRCRIQAQRWATENPGRLAAKDARYRAKKMQATPLWADQTKIEEFYFTANMLGMHSGDWYHVDHVVPIQSNLVCGLHCQQNLQILTDVANKVKGNRVWPDMPSDVARGEADTFVGVGVWARW